MAGTEVKTCFTDNVISFIQTLEYKGVLQFQAIKAEDDGTIGWNVSWIEPEQTEDQPLMG